MTVLEPMPPERFDAFADVSIASHAADNVGSGRWREHESETLARAEFGRLLPQKAATPEHHFYEIKPHPSGPVLGFVWLGSLPRGNVRVALFSSSSFTQSIVGGAMAEQRCSKWRSWPKSWA